MAEDLLQKPRVLVVDDDGVTRALLTDFLLSTGFLAVGASGGEEALSLLASPPTADSSPSFDLMLSDIVMPGMDGLALLRAVRDRHPAVGTLVVTSRDDVGTAIEAIRLGAFDYLTKPLLLEELPVTLAKAMEKRRLLRIVAAAREEMDRAGAGVEALASLVDVLESKDTYSDGHCRRVGMYSSWLAAELGLAAGMRGSVLQAARLHDLGKLLIAGPWLNQPGPLSKRDVAVLREHSLRGVESLREVLNPLELSFIAAHHERWDGKGYPAGIAAHRIPLGARVIAIADSYDAMTSRRSFRQTFLAEDALDEVSRCAGSQFDPQMVPPFLAVVRRRLAQAGP